MERLTVVVTTIDSTGLPTNVLIERRRPGRAKYANPHLIALLRNSTEAASDDQVDVAKDRNDLRLDRGREARLSKTISLIDGASQVGIPHPVTNLEHESRTLWYGPFLANQCCYVAGTEIATSHGAMPIEKVAVGDVVLSLSGNRRVTWTGRFSINPSAEPNPERTAPVCIRRDAFASGLPGQDQWVSPLHCLWVDNRLVPARLLINNMTVIQDLLATSVTYCHLLFDKSAHGQLAASVDLVKPIWDRLSERAEHLGCGRASPTEAVDLSLQILADGKPIHPTEIVGSRQVFVVPPGHEIFHVWSNSFAAVVMVEIIAKDVYQVIPADHPDLLLGWGPCQREGGRDWRCVEGAALLPISQVSGGMQIVVHLRKSGRAYAEIQKSLDEINQKVPATSSQ
jgi:hypothetical protein